MVYNFLFWQNGAKSAGMAVLLKVQVLSHCQRIAAMVFMKGSLAQVFKHPNQPELPLRSVQQLGWLRQNPAQVNRKTKSGSVFN